MPSPVDLPDPVIKPGSPALQADSLPTELLGNPLPKNRGSFYMLLHTHVIGHSLPGPLNILELRE